MLSEEEVEERIKYAKSNFTDGIEIFLEIIEQLRKENKKQNKMIDEMANHIANWDAEEDICKKVEKPLCNNGTSVPVSYCVDCTKQYFEKKVEEK